MTTGVAWEILPVSIKLVLCVRLVDFITIFIIIILILRIILRVIADLIHLPKFERLMELLKA